MAAGDSLGLFALLGLNIAILRTMPTSTRKAADVLTSAVAVVLGRRSSSRWATRCCCPGPRRGSRTCSTRPATIAVFCVLVAATGLNVLSDSVFLAINRVWSYLRLNGILMGVAKCALPFALAGAGALGLYASVGGAILVCAVASVWVILRHVPGRRSLSPSPELLASRGFAAAGYVTYVLTVLPLLVFPLIVINALGPAQGGAYFISFQVVTLLHAVVLAVANSAYAEAERAEHHRHRVVRKGGLTLLVCSVAGCLAMMVAAPYFLAIFGAALRRQRYDDAARAVARDGRRSLQLLVRDAAAAGEQPERDDPRAAGQHRGDARAGRGARSATARSGWPRPGASATSSAGCSASS